MKNLFSVVVLLSLLGNANAQTAALSCDDVADLAVEIMQKRQVNYDIMLLINTMNDELFDRPSLLNLMQPMIDKAYSEAAATDADAREQQVAMFRTFWTEQCDESDQ